MFPLTNLIAGGVAGVALGAPVRRGLPASPGRLPAACLLPGKFSKWRGQVAGQRSWGSGKAWIQNFPLGIDYTLDIQTSTNPLDSRDAMRQMTITHFTDKKQRHRVSLLQADDCPMSRYFIDILSPFHLPITLIPFHRGRVKTPRG